MGLSWGQRWGKVTGDSVHLASAPGLVLAPTLSYANSRIFLSEPALSRLNVRDQKL